MFPVRPFRPPIDREAAIRAAAERQRTHEQVEAMRRALANECATWARPPGDREIAEAARDLVAAGWRLR